ncbi:HAMP domain-containing sensor histidine kinase [Subtercola sp. RTI3]|uniref:sensor histidine kinase n=1 Tax=Subtercola sp. RTI3 TaxID=3048639 RepID=UPI002B23701E|nr:HAMP domain-containing sensor histidine kinase [Subtercola sp. RTI3]MEA9984894.1 HAMP domain-containing sensor histidine kinase [Subtercola sp. RTI3]
MLLSDIADVALIAFVTTIVIGGCASVLLLALRRASLFAQLCVVVLAVTLSAVASMITVANAMYLSAHDLTVAVAVASIAGVVSLALAALLGWMIVRNSRALSAATRKLGAGERVDEVGRHYSAELAALGAELVSASARLADAHAQTAQLEASRRELVAWISHDLRTPLAGLRAMSESLEDGLADDTQRYYRQMRSQVDQLSRMVDDLFELSKIDSGTLQLTLDDVSLFDIVSDAVADVQSFAAGREIRVASAFRRDVVVRADARELSRAITNLLVNALQHSPHASPITVSADVFDGHASLSVIDGGSGIPDADLARVFEPGWRGASARTPAVGLSAGTAATPGSALTEPHSSGAGLGLAIVRGIAEAHNGSVSVRNVPGGCRFDLSLPTAA